MSIILGEWSFNRHHDGLSMIERDSVLLIHALGRLLRLISDWDVLVARLRRPDFMKV